MMSETELCLNKLALAREHTHDLEMMGDSWWERLAAATGRSWILYGDSCGINPRREEQMLTRMDAQYGLKGYYSKG